jgi:hypothetical protein
MRKLALILFIRLCFLLPAVGSAIAFRANCQILVDAGEEGSFRSLGVAEDGTVFIVGTWLDSPVVFQVVGTTLEHTRIIPPASTDWIEDFKISRDGRYLVAQVDEELEGYERIALWSVTNLNQPRALQDANAEPYQRLSPIAVASTTAGPLLLGAASRGPFTWTERTGFRYWPIRDNARNLLYQMSSDGTRFVGGEISLEGTNWRSRPIVAEGESISYLDSRGGLRAEAAAISPDGSRIGGLIDLQSVIWEKGKAHRLNLGTNSHVLFFITDSGWAAGSSSSGPVIHDARGRKLELFDDWWTKEFPESPLPGPIRRIRDFHEHAGHLYFLLGYYDAVNDRTPDLLVIVPLAGLTPGKKSD